MKPAPPPPRAAALILHTPEPAAAAAFLGALQDAPGLRLGADPLPAEAARPGFWPGFKPGFRLGFLLDHAFARPGARMEGLRAYLAAELGRGGRMPVLPSAFLWGRAGWLGAEFPAAAQILIHGDPWRMFCAAWCAWHAGRDPTALAMPFALLERNAGLPAVALLIESLALPIRPARRHFGSARGRIGRWARHMPDLPALTLYRATLALWALSETAGGAMAACIDPDEEGAPGPILAAALGGALGAALGAAPAGLPAALPPPAPAAAAPAAAPPGLELGGIDIWRCHDELIRVLAQAGGSVWSAALLARMQAALRGTTLRAERALSAAPQPLCRMLPAY